MSDSEFEDEPMYDSEEEFQYGSDDDFDYGDEPITASPVPGARKVGILNFIDQINPLACFCNLGQCLSLCTNPYPSLSAVKSRAQRSIYDYWSHHPNPTFDRS